MNRSQRFGHYACAACAMTGAAYAVRHIIDSMGGYAVIDALFTLCFVFRAELYRISLRGGAT